MQAGEGKEGNKEGVKQGKRLVPVLASLYPRRFRHFSSQVIHKKELYYVKFLIQRNSYITGVMLLRQIAQLIVFFLTLSPICSIFKSTFSSFFSSFFSLRNKVLLRTLTS